MPSTAGFIDVPADLFAHLFDKWRATANHADSTSTFTHVEGTRYRVNGYAGYAVRPDGDLVMVHSHTRGMGDALMADALENGAETLDCFDGYLPTFYARHGFVEVDRADNWTPGGPDVVFMRRAHRHGYDRRVSAILCYDCPTIPADECDPAIVADFEGEPIRPSADYCESPVAR